VPLLLTLAEKNHMAVMISLPPAPLPHTLYPRASMHSLTGAPGGYQRIGPLRLDECATYGCLLELTIQLAIIFVGKQILNNAQEIGLP